MDHHSRGFALLLSVILTSVSLAIGLALLDVAYKQVIISTTAKQSGIAFYNADSAMECALYYDQKADAFNYGAALPYASGVCAGKPMSFSLWMNGASPHTRTYTVPCTIPGITGTSSMVTVYKYSNNTTAIFASGYNTCNTSDPRRVERGLKINY